LKRPKEEIMLSPLAMLNSEILMAIVGLPALVVGFFVLVGVKTAANSEKASNISTDN
jgi:hypothetical protein